MKLRCACGWETEADTEDALVAVTTEHGRQFHNMTPTREQVLEMIVPDA